MAWPPNFRGMIPNSVIDILRYSLTRRFPVVKDDAFDELLETLRSVAVRQGHSTQETHDRS